MFHVSPITAVITTVASIVLISTIVGMYQREISFVDFKFDRKSGYEIDATYYDPLQHIAEGPNYSNNNNPGTGGNGVNLGDDADWDGLDNAQEQTLGTDIYDPDTDDDGTSDGIEILVSTDPKDPASGGLKYISYTPPSDTTPPPTNNTVPPIDNKLVISGFTKRVRNITKGESTWKDSTYADIGDLVAFRIKISAINPSTTSILTANISDQLGKGLDYTEDSGQITFMGGAPVLLPANWRSGYAIAVNPELNPQKNVDIEITFTSSLYDDPIIKSLGSTLNQATLSIGSTTTVDTAFVKLNK